MKIGLLIYGSIDTVSGGYLYNRKLVAFLRAQGDVVEVVSLPWRDDWRHLGDNVGNRLVARLAALNVDVLIVDGMCFRSVAGVLGRLRSRVRYRLVGLIHLLAATDGAAFFGRTLEAHFLRALDGVICTSETTRRELVDRYGIIRPSVVAYPGGDRFAQVPPVLVRRRGDRPLRMLYVGNVIARKGLHIVLAAMAQLDGVTLWVVGPLSAEPAYTKQIFHLLKQYQLDERVHFLGAADGDALAVQYADSDLFVMPSRYESFGIVYLEAQQFSLPVIATTAGAAHELVHDGDNGFLIPPDDVAALRTRLQLLRDDPARLVSMQQAARSRFDQHPTWEAGLTQIASFLRRCCE